VSTSLVQDLIVAALSKAVDRVCESGDHKIPSVLHPTVELPKREEWGDFSSNVAMALAPKVHRPPIEIADAIAKELQVGSTELFERVEVAAPGFLNLTVRPNRWVEILRAVESQGQSFGTGEVGKGQRVLVEFVSANPTGPLHVGHGRGAALGHAVSNLLMAAGYEVEREYYINDVGRQLRLLGSSVFVRYREHFGESVSFPEEGYHGSYIRAIAERLAQESGSTLLDLSGEEAESQCAAFACQRLLENLKEDLQVFGIQFDSWYSEARLHDSGRIQQALTQLKERDLVFQNEGAWWFRSSKFGDEKDRVVEKQDGDYTYLASDIAYHRDKLERGYDSLINIWGADHHGYISRMQAAVQSFGYPKDRLRVVLVQMVILLRGGKKIEMSKRAGEFVTLREVVDEVGADAAKFFFLMRRSDSHLDFDLDLAKKQSSDNPVYYVQYAHARLSSLFRVAQGRGVPIPSVDDVDHTLLMNPDELRLMKHLSCYPGIVEGSAVALEPHRLTFYLQELAAHLHTYYYKHRVLPPLEGSPANGDEPLSEAGAVQESTKEQSETITPEVTAARLALMRQVQIVIKNGLGLLGISAPDQM
jgi:arginyl-tRNA synthetase